MNKKLTISAKDEKVPFPAAVRGSETPVLKLSSVCIADVAQEFVSRNENRKRKFCNFKRELR